MAFPWKKVKNNRLSKLVNDHLQNSQRRRDGSSLVVETGFATSLVDLFIKNREKLTKPSRKKRQSLPIKPHGRRKPPPLESPSPPTNTPLSCPSPLQSPAVLPSPSEDVGEMLVLGGKNVDEDVREGYAEKAQVINGVVLIIFKFIFVGVLALGTKRLALVITIAACSLLFLEYVRKHMLKPSYVKAKTLLRFWSLLRSEDKLKKITSDVILGRKIEEDDFLVPSDSSLTISESRHDHRIVEIQVVAAADSSVARAVTNGGRFFDRLENVEHFKPKIVQEQSVSKALEVKKMKNSRGAAIKSKMKKFIAAKFKTSRKLAQAAEEDKDVSIRTSGESYQEVDIEESEGGNRYSSCSTSTRNDETNGALAEVKEKTTMNMKEGSSPTTTVHGASLRFFSALCPIILVGLVHGRVTALVLALSCCFLLRLCEVRLDGYNKGFSLTDL